MIIGKLDDKITSILEIEMPDDPMIYLGDQNIRHMISKQPDDYRKYGDRISEIVSEPDYVYLDPGDNSIEFIKEFIIFGEYVKVAVRASAASVYYVRTLYVIRNERVEDYIKNGKLKKVH